MPYYLTHFSITIKFIFFKTLHTKNKNDEGKLEIERLRKEKPLKFTHLFPQDYKRENNIVIMFQSVKKLEKYINIIKEDRGFKAADVLIFVQTSSLDSDKLLLD